MFQIHFRDSGITNTKYCFIRLNGHNPINTLHIATLCMNFSSVDGKLLAVYIPEHRLAKYPELSKAIHETLFPLLKGAHKSDAEKIINTFIISYDDVK